jgi:hypothetical protein
MKHYTQASINRLLTAAAQVDQHHPRRRYFRCRQIVNCDLCTPRPPLASLAYSPSGCLPQEKDGAASAAEQRNGSRGGPASGLGRGRGRLPSATGMRPGGRGLIPPSGPPNNRGMQQRGIRTFPGAGGPADGYNDGRGRGPVRRSPQQTAAEPALTDAATFPALGGARAASASSAAVGFAHILQDKLGTLFVPTFSERSVVRFAGNRR